LIIHSDENSLVWKSFKNEQLILRQRVFRFSQLYDMGKNGHGRIGSFLGFSNDQMWTIHFTSGTTGTSKGVCHTPASLFASACSFSKALGFHSSLNMYHVLPMHYMAGFLNTVLCPFVSGGAVLISRPFGPGSALNFWQNPKAYSVNVLWLVPSMLVALLKLDRDEGIRDWVRKSIKMVCVGTAPLAEPVKKDFEMKYGIPVLQSYGLSETLFVSSNTLNSPRSDGSVGVLLDGVQVKICDNVGGEFMSETNGEILIRSNGMMVGYWNSKSECPVAELKDGWFQSGDIGWVNSNGELFITGRIKDIIIKGGENISPKKVADALMLHPDIEEAVVVGVPHDFYGEEVAAALRLKPGLCLSDREASIRQHCIGCLPPIAVPKIFRQFDEFPRGSTGKILNREIKRFF
jgi:long-chain acyl-CoA synthetase